MASDNHDRLAAKVVDGFQAAHFRLPDPAALANTLIDYLHIACCGAYRLRLQDAAVQEDRNALYTGVGLGRRRLVLEAIEPDRRAAIAEGQKQAAGRISAIIESLREGHRELWRHVEAQFIEALCTGTPAEAAAAPLPPAGDSQRLLLDRITERIRQSLGEYEQTRSPRDVFLSTDPLRMRVVTVHRFFKGEVPFGRVVLAQSQVDAFHGRSPTGDGAAADLLVAPLSDFPPAIQRCFELGFALYGSWLGAPAPDFAGAVKGVLGLKPDGPPPRACFIPCHVGGVAWTVSAIVTSRLDRGFAELCLGLYREWIPRVFEALRTRTQDDFLSWMLYSYQRGLAGPSPDRSEINAEWACIRQHYPLPRWDLEQARPGQDDRHVLRLPRIRGQEWIIRRDGARNEYYRPSERLWQPASWGAGTLWGETLLDRMSEITAYTSQSHDLQRLRAAQEAVASWAHEVKSYTTPVISDLRSASRKTEESAPAAEPLRRALRAAMILNACSFAAQKILENRATPSAETRIFLLPAGNCENIVEAMLQYLLQYWRSASPLPLKLAWDPELSERDALGLLASALRPGASRPGASVDEALLTHPAVVGVVSLLREVVFNIRCREPVTEPLVRICRRMTREPNRLRLTLEQHQEERFAWSSNPDEPKGLRRANRLYGPEGAQLGHIVSYPPEQVRTSTGVSIKYVVEVAFNLAP
ncbi:MAG: hypothetical protein ABSG79_03840 [Bryobacteraceae bacterium]|jgi:hypothetical protein